LARTDGPCCPIAAWPYSLPCPWQHEITLVSTKCWEVHYDPKRTLSLAAARRGILGFRAVGIQPDAAVPARHDRKTIDDFAVTTADLNRDRSVGAFLGGQVVRG